MSSGRRIARAKVPGQVAAELVRAAPEPAAAVPVALVAPARAREVGDR
ncbi:MAG: hypothetical protein L0I24_23640 [Pseudonocardia sp.]|nr:hypothetical protein [Pseudonocardia sp.]